MSKKILNYLENRYRKESPTYASIVESNFDVVEKHSYVYSRDLDILYEIYKIVKVYPSLVYLMYDFIDYIINHSYSPHLFYVPSTDEEYDITVEYGRRRDYVEYDLKDIPYKQEFKNNAINEYLPVGVNYLLETRKKVVQRSMVLNYDYYFFGRIKYKILRERSREEHVNMVSYVHPNVIAIQREWRVYLWNLLTQSLINEIEGFAGISQIAIANNLLFTVSYYLNIYDIESTKVLFTSVKNGVWENVFHTNRVLISPTGEIAVQLDSDIQIFIYKDNELTPTLLFKNRYIVKWEDNLIVKGDHSDYYVIHAGSEIPFESESVINITYDDTRITFEFTSKSVFLTVEQYRKEVKMFNKNIAVVAYSNKICLYDLNTMELINTFFIEDITAMEILLGYILIGTNKGLTLVDVEKETLRTMGDTSNIREIIILPNNQVITTSAYGGVDLWA